MVHLILQRSHSIYHSWKYAVHNENRIAVVWPGCSRREVRQLRCYEAFWTSRVLILQASCWHVRLGFSPVFFPSPKEWKTLYLHRVMAVLLHLKLHHLPHEQFALLFKMRSGGRSYLKFQIFRMTKSALLFIWEELRTSDNGISLFSPTLALGSIWVTRVHMLP